MTSTNDAIHRQKIEELRLQYEREDYQVLIEPTAVQLPFALGSYTPDLVARKADGTGGLIVEVRTKGARGSVERFQAIAQAVREHPGWRFLMVSVEDLSVASKDHQLASWEELSTKLVQARQLLNSGMRDAAVLYLWSIFEGAMRQLAVATATPVERLPASKLMNQLYTIGYISVSELQTAKQFLQLRNQVAHGFRSDEGDDLIKEFSTLLSGWVASWRNEPAQTDPS
ncbi:REase-like protein [compost metagenome]